MTNGTFISNEFNWSFNANASNPVEFTFDNTVCGDQGRWVSGACDDKRWYPTFRQSPGLP